MTKKKKPKSSEKPPLQYITEDYCPLVLVFRRLNDIYGEHTAPLDGQYTVNGNGMDDQDSILMTARYHSKGWLFERVNIDDAPEE